MYILLNCCNDTLIGKKLCKNNVKIYHTCFLNLFHERGKHIGKRRIGSQKKEILGDRFLRIYPDLAVLECIQGINLYLC